MRRRFSVALGFSLGLGSASLLSPNFYAGLSPVAIANLTLPVTPAIPFSTGAISASCSSSTNLQRTSLLRHVPSPPQNLNWYGITQNSAIANAPKTTAPPLPQVHWNAAPPEQFSPSLNCSTGPDLAVSPSPSRGQDQQRISPQLLKQRAHFILSLASLKQKSDWMLQPLPAQPQAIHSMWREHDISKPLPTSIATATSAQALPQSMAKVINIALQSDPEANNLSQ